MIPRNWLGCLAACLFAGAAACAAQETSGGAGEAEALVQEGLALAKKKGDANNLAEAARRFLRAAEGGHPVASAALEGVWNGLPHELRVPMLGVFGEECRGFRTIIRLYPWAPDGGGRTLASAIGQLGQPAAKEGTERRALLAALAASDPEIAAAARRALAQAFGDAAADAFAKIYGATDEALPGAVGQVANDARQGNRGATEALVITARDPDPDIRTKAAEWLGANAGTDPAALAAIQSMAADPDPHIRQSGAFALHAISSRRPELLQILLNAAKDPDDSVRLTAVIGLAADAIRHNTAATEALVAASKDPNPTIRTKAVEGLGNAIASGNDKARAFLKNLATAKDPQLAPIARDYLKKYPVRK